MGTLATLLQRLDDKSSVRGKQFERICHWYLTTDPLYRRELKRVWLWDEWPGRWGADAGIDLVAEARDGRLWAIQAKAYDPRYRIKKSDVDTFLSESARPGFSFRLLIATTNEIGATAKRTLVAQEKPGHLLFLADLERASVEWPTSPNKLVGKPAKSKHPRPHQRQAIRDVVRGFEKTDRGQLIMACGTGKTLTALWIREALAAERTLVLLPSLSLLAQTLREWVVNAAQEFEFLPVCSDETVTGTDSLVSKTADLGFPVTTESAEIASFLRKRGARVIFSTYQSSPQIAEALVGRVPGFDLAIADEAHRCAGRVSGDFATILDDRAIHSRRRLFMTATPRYFTGRVIKEAAAADLEVASMDDPARFGPVFHRLTFGEAIERDLLSDYQVAVVVVNDATFREYAERGLFVTMDGEKVTDARTLAAQIGLAKAMRRFDLRRIVSFHSRVAWARDFSHSLPEVVAWMPARERPKGLLWSSYVSGEMPSGHRDVLLGRLRDLDDERVLLSNARCLAEGVDVPTLDGVAFVDPRRSEVDVVQAVGRAIRKAPDKKVGTVVLPVFVASNADAQRALDSSAFRDVWKVLNALRAHDEVLAKQLDALRRDLGRRGTLGRRPAKVALVLPIGVDVRFTRAFDACLVERTTATWELGFGRLEAFVEREGHARVPAVHVDESGFKLGGWVVHQRQLGTSRAEPRHARQLECLPGWTWQARDTTWEEAFDRLEAYVAERGSARVLASHVDVTGFPLGQWVVVQRQFKRRGALATERGGRLESLPGWSWHTFESEWDRGVSHLRRHVDEDGDADVPQGFVSADGYHLGRWMSKQRTKYAQGRLTEGQVRELSSIPGWTWTVLAEAWETAFQRLVRYTEVHGHALVPTDYRDDDGFPLGRWAHNQVTWHATGKMPSTRAARLESLPGWDWGGVLAGRWEQAFALLAEYAAAGGTARLKVSWRDPTDGFALGQWAANQRGSFARGKMPRDRAARLEALPGWVWDAR